jgi:hypothetical protein
MIKNFLVLLIILNFILGIVVAYNGLGTAAQVCNNSLITPKEIAQHDAVGRLSLTNLNSIDKSVFFSICAEMAAYANNVPVFLWAYENTEDFHRDISAIDIYFITLLAKCDNVSTELWKSLFMNIVKSSVFLGLAVLNNGPKDLIGAFTEEDKDTIKYRFEEYGGLDYFTIKEISDRLAIHNVNFSYNVELHVDQELKNMRRVVADIGYGGWYPLEKSQSQYLDYERRLNNFLRKVDRKYLTKDLLQYVEETITKSRKALRLASVRSIMLARITGATAAGCIAGYMCALHLGYL